MECVVQRFWRTEKRVISMSSMVVSAFNMVKPFRGKQRALKALFRWLPFAQARSYYGVRMVKNIEDSTWRACMVGGYGTFISDYISSLSRPFIFLDIGSNQGLFGLFAAQHPLCSRVVAFEPNPHTFSLLVRNISLSVHSEKIHPVCAAIGSNDSYVMDMVVPVNHSGASTSQKTDKIEGRHFRSIVVQGKFLEDIVHPEEGREIHAKIDVEGAEMLVLEQLSELGLLDRITSVIVEISANIEGTRHMDEIVSFFDEHRWVLTSRSDGKTHYDAVYTNTNAN
jgi:FkbM family methyltransferase